MTTPPPIPPEAMDGRECLVWIQGNSTPAIGVYCGLLEGWFVDRANVAREVVFLAIPISWCHAVKEQPHGPVVPMRPGQSQGVDIKLWGNTAAPGQPGAAP